MNPWLHLRRHLRRWLLGACGVLLACAAHAASPEAEALLKLHASLTDRMAHSMLDRPAYIESAELPDGLRGDIYAVLDHPVDEVTRALTSPVRWCEMLLLHINNRQCRLSKEGGAEVLTLGVVRNYDQPVESAFQLPFTYRVVSATADYLAVELSSDTGPLGTSNYHVQLRVVGLGHGRSFMHLGYSYDHNTIVRLATQAYLATFGANKVGFTVVGKQANGEPQYVAGLRGLVERNAMRYFLAADAYLDAFDITPPSRQFDQRVRTWFALSEHYPRQLHEIDLATYVALKRADQARDNGR
jgi:hypothetical protein